MRKPGAAEAKAREIAAITVPPDSAAVAAIARPAAAAVMPAMPSMPSMKLKALVRPTIQRSVSGQAAGPRSTVPSEPSETPSIGPSAAVAAAAASRWTPKRVRFDSDCTSSSQLTPATASDGSRTAARRDTASGRKAAAMPAATATTATMASPPPRGVSRVWLLRALGASTMPWRRAQSTIRRVSSAEPAHAATHQAAQNATVHHA